MHVSAKLRVDSSLGVCEQENQGREIGAAYPSVGCSTVAVSWTRSSFDALTFFLQICTNGESRRATSNRLPLLQLRVCLRTF
jgi:hypothetical protein